MAQMRSPAMSALSPLLEHKRSQRGHDEISAIDPTATSAAPNANALDAGFSPIKVPVLADRMFSRLDIGAARLR